MDPAEFPRWRFDLVPDRAVAFRAGPRQLADQSDLFFFSQLDLPKRFINRAQLGPDKWSRTRKFDLANAFTNDLDSRFGNDAETTIDWTNRTPSIGVVAINFDDLSCRQFLRAVVDFARTTSNQRIVFRD